MAMGFDDVIFYVALALVELVVSTSISENQAKDAEKRAARETQVRSWYSAIRNAFSVTKQQLDQFLDNLGLNMNSLKDATQGSARLSRASKIYREFMSLYPEIVNNVNSAKNTIEKVGNDLSKKEEQAASTIQKRGDVENIQVLKDLSGARDAVNASLQSVPNADVDTTAIDTSLKPLENQTKVDAAAEAKAKEQRERTQEATDAIGLNNPVSNSHLK